MTKRFYYDYENPDGAKIIDLQTHKKYTLETIGDFMEIENLLNELNDENIRLKQQNENLLEKI